MRPMAENLYGPLIAPRLTKWHGIWDQVWAFIGSTTPKSRPRPITDGFLTLAPG